MKRLLVAIAALFALPTFAHAQAASVTLPQPPPAGGLICFNNFVYSFSSSGPTGFTYLLGGSACTGTFFPFTLTGGGMAGGGSEPYNHVADGPNSAQFQQMRAALDLESIDVEGDARFAPDGDADTIGGAATYWNAPGIDGERLEGRYAKQWRPFEGQRTRASLVAPVNGIITNTGEAAVSGSLSGGLEFPVQPNWSITPRASFGGAVGSSFFGGDGVTGAVTVASRYRFPQIGRGDLVIGNMIGYTGDSVLGQQNGVFRNGIAYQFPIKTLMFGRQTSARVSYVNTHFIGDAKGIENYNEFAINFGVRLREQDVRNKFEALRVGLLYTNASGYDSVTFTVGYRF